LLVVRVTAASATAATNPVHVKRSFGPFVVDVPAGALCDFGYHQEDSGQLNIKRLFDEEGSLVRVEVQVEETIVDRNADTGETLTEELHYARHADFVDGEVQNTGQSWQLRDEGGRPVFSGAGLIAVDLLTGEVTGETPGAEADASVCAMLGAG
jgi:hypothetical protein